MLICFVTRHSGAAHRVSFERGYVLYMLGHVAGISLVYVN